MSYSHFYLEFHAKKMRFEARHFFGFFLNEKSTRNCFGFLLLFSSIHRIAYTNEAKEHFDIVMMNEQQRRLVFRLYFIVCFYVFFISIRGKSV